MIYIYYLFLFVVYSLSFTFYFLFFTFYFSLFLLFLLFLLLLFGGFSMAAKCDFRRAFDRVRTPTVPSGLSMTKQSFSQECDINSIMSRYKTTGVLPPVVSDSRFGDFSSGDDFHSVCDRMISAQNAFDILPAKVRSRFHNDPGALLDFLADGRNRDEAIFLGLIEKPAAAHPQDEGSKDSDKPLDKPI